MMGEWHRAKIENLLGRADADQGELCTAGEIEMLGAGVSHRMEWELLKDIHKVLLKEYPQCLKNIHKVLLGVLVLEKGLETFVFQKGHEMFVLYKLAQPGIAEKC